MLSLRELSKKIADNIGNPGVIADIGLELASYYGELTDRFIELEILKATFFDSIKFEGTKPLSDSAVNAKFTKTTEGNEYLIIRLQLKGLEKLMSMVKNHTYVKNQEANSQW